MLPFTGHEPTVTRNRRRRVAIAIGLSLAVHLVALVLFLAVGVGPGGQEGASEPGPGEYVMVADPDQWLGADSAEAVAAPTSVTQPALSASRPGGGSASSSSGDRRRPGPRRSRSNASTPVPAAPPSSQPPAAGRPQPPVIAQVDPAAEAARNAFRAELRRRLKETWRAYDVYRRVDPHGRMQGALFTSVVQVRFGADGKVERSKLSASSGVDDIDKQALLAVAQIKPLPPVPPHMLDDQRGLTVNCKFFLDVGMFMFAAKIRVAIEGRWRPSRSFATSSDESERTTVLQLLLARDGKLLSTKVVSSAGIDFLDENPRNALEPGTLFPVPPPAFTRQPGPAQVFVSFAHKAAQVRILKPREDIEEE